MPLRWSAAAGSDIGRTRESNEDAYRSDPERGLFVIGDGMGGHAAGEVASRLAVETAYRRLASQVDHGLPLDDDDAVELALRDAFDDAHREIREWSAAHPAAAGLGSTLIATLITPTGRLHAGHVGDSRLHVCSDAEFRCLTTDHTWVTREVVAGRLSHAAARNHRFSHILTNVVTDDAELQQVEMVHATVSAGDVVLLTTDGLHGLVSEAMLGTICRRETPVAALKALIDEALRAGGTDNATAIVVRLSH